MKNRFQTFLRTSLMATMLLSVSVAAQPVLTTLVSFGYSNGAYPIGGVIFGADGNLYGTTYQGGQHNGGTVFQLTANRVINPLISFNGTDGNYPVANLILGNGGNLYGTTLIGGSGGGNGTVFRVTTNGVVVTNFVSFVPPNGADLYSSLVLGNDGNFYGTTRVGGTNSQERGTVFRMTTDGMLTTLDFFSVTNGSYPFAGLTLGPDGYFYGTTQNGGTNGDWGTVFRVDTNGLLVTLACFANTNGAQPLGNLTWGNDGNLYGTTSSGGTYNSGTVFQVTTNGLLTSLLSFNGTNGANPYSGLTLAKDGNFYGTTLGGGNKSGYGTVFLVTTNGLLNTLITFNGTNGAHPYAALTLGPDGTFYGTTYYGGTNRAGAGTVFSLSVPPIPPVIRTTGGILTNGQFQFAFTNYLPGASYNALSATDLCQPVSNWIPVASLSNLPPGTLQFSVPFNTDEIQRFYRLQLIQ